MSFEIKLKSAARQVNALVVVRPLEWWVYFNLGVLDP